MQKISFDQGAKRKNMILQMSKTEKKVKALDYGIPRGDFIIPVLLPHVIPMPCHPSRSFPFRAPPPCAVCLSDLKSDAGRERSTLPHGDGHRYVARRTGPEHTPNEDTVEFAFLQVQAELPITEVHIYKRKCSLSKISYSPTNAYYKISQSTFRITILYVCTRIVPCKPSSRRITAQKYTTNSRTDGSCKYGRSGLRESVVYSHQPPCLSEPYLCGFLGQISTE